MKKVLIAIIFLALALPLFAIDCPSCGGNLLWIGQTKFEWGKMLKLCKCPAGHYYWVTTDQERQDNQRRFNSYGGNAFDNDSNSSSNRSYSGTVRCPICNGSMYFTGRTELEWGRLLKIYRCPSGHEAVIK
jgi:hypothetical protein